MRGIKAARRASVALAVAALAALALGPAADAAKKKKAKAKPVDIANAANAVIPDRGAGATDPRRFSGPQALPAAQGGQRSGWVGSRVRAMSLT